MLTIMKNHAVERQSRFQSKMKVRMAEGTDVVVEAMVVAATIVVAKEMQSQRGRKYQAKQMLNFSI